MVFKKFLWQTVPWLTDDSTSDLFLHLLSTYLLFPLVLIRLRDGGKKTIKVIEYNFLFHKGL